MLNFLIWVILIYFALLLIWRYVVPFLLRRYFRKLERRFEQYRTHGQPQDQHANGDVHIENIPDEPSGHSGFVDENDYVDFEEIKDDEEPKT